MLGGCHYRVLHHQRRRSVRRANIRSVYLMSVLNHIYRPTLIDGHSPQGIQCWLVFQGDGGILSLPMYVPLYAFTIQYLSQHSHINLSRRPQETGSSAPHTNTAITIALPIVISLVAVILLVGGSITFLHVRNKRRRAAGGVSGEKRAWVNRKAGWAEVADEEAGITRPEVAQVAHRESILYI